MPIRQVPQIIRERVQGRSQDTDPSEKPLIVAYDTTDRFQNGAELTVDRFYHVLDDYDAIIVHWKEGDHPSQDEHYLLYRDATAIELDGKDVERVDGRPRSTEVAGEFAWFKHGQELAVDMSIGIRCRHTPTWEELP